MNDDVLLKREEALLLFDEYKNLLTSSQQNIFFFFFLYDLSLSVIAEIYHISKAAASDSLHKSLTKLQEYEEKLHEVSFKKKVLEAIQKNDFTSIREELKNGI